MWAEPNISMLCLLFCLKIFALQKNKMLKLKFLFWHKRVAWCFGLLAANKNAIGKTFPIFVKHAIFCLASYIHCFAMMKRRNVRFVIKHIAWHIWHNLCFVHAQIGAIRVFVYIQIFAIAFCFFVISATIFAAHNIHIPTSKKDDWQTMIV